MRTAHRSVLLMGLGACLRCRPLRLARCCGEGVEMFWCLVRQFNVASIVHREEFWPHARRLLPHPQHRLWCSIPACCCAGLTLSDYSQHLGTCVGTKLE